MYMKRSLYRGTRNSAKNIKTRRPPQKTKTPRNNNTHQKRNNKLRNERLRTIQLRQNKKNKSPYKYIYIYKYVCVYT